MEALAAHVATAIDNAQLFSHEKMERKHILDELDEAQGFQRTLMPNEAPSQGVFAMSGLCLPCRAVGGDWFDYIPMADGRIAVVVADVSGKGMPAALLMASTRSIVRLVAERVMTPAAVLTQLNDVLPKDLPHSKFVTMVYALLNPADRTVTFASAGHNPPLLVSEEGSRFVESMRGTPLGIWKGAFSEQRLEITPGSRFVLYSDGVSEAANPASEEYGASRIQTHFNRSESSVDSLLHDIHQFSAGAPLEDDATVVLIDTLAS